MPGARRRGPGRVWSGRGGATTLGTMTRSAFCRPPTPLLGALLCGVVLRTAAADAQRPRAPRAPAVPSLGALRDAFRRAGAPGAGPFDPATLVGRWVMTAAVTAGVPAAPAAARDRSGRRPPDVVFVGVDGARRDDLPGRPLEWVLDVAREGGGRLTARSHHPWAVGPDTGPVPTPLTAAGAGEVRLEYDEGGDTARLLRCRIPAPGRLVCLAARADGGAGAFAVEFRRFPAPAP